ncbi:mycofactocin precursor MftA [Nocardioides currus]|uniref:Mycofactocin n=1 Tax=Nocardioides currus TaxID=2133958 RepID=A0A2R7YZ85_9ACTN|nr:mycofactocin precursor MftA [Nocardioides currus]PUA81624.1 mycofactocin precursor [Nocardioides currus]
MTDPTQDTAVDTALETDPHSDWATTEDALVEEVSIDGMCGVY